jgi:hypothetical protein
MEPFLVKIFAWRQGAVDDQDKNIAVGSERRICRVGWRARFFYAMQPRGGPK